MFPPSGPRKIYDLHFSSAWRLKRSSFVSSDGWFTEPFKNMKRCPSRFFTSLSLSTSTTLIHDRIFVENSSERSISLNNHLRNQQASTTVSHRQQASWWTLDGTQRVSLVGENHLSSLPPFFSHQLTRFSRVGLPRPKGDLTVARYIRTLGQRWKYQRPSGHLFFFNPLSGRSGQVTRTYVRSLRSTRTSTLPGSRGWPAGVGRLCNLHAEPLLSLTVETAV